jgi:hypothetical protein
MATINSRTPRKPFEPSGSIEMRIQVSPRTDRESAGVELSERQNAGSKDTLPNWETVSIFWLPSPRISIYRNFTDGVECQVWACSRKALHLDVDRCPPVPDRDFWALPGLTASPYFFLNFEGLILNSALTSIEKRRKRRTSELPRRVPALWVDRYDSWMQILGRFVSSTSGALAACEGLVLRAAVSGSSGAMCRLAL